jgi:hypothetical protein
MMMPNTVSLAVSEASMRESNQNVQKLDVQFLDKIPASIAKSYRIIARRSWLKLNFLTGSVTAEKTETIVEPTDARH